MTERPYPSGMLSGEQNVLSIKHIPSKIISENSSKLTSSLSPNLLRNPKILDQSKITDYSMGNTIQQEDQKYIQTDITANNGRNSEQSKDVLLRQSPTMDFEFGAQSKVNLDMLIQKPKTKVNDQMMQIKNYDI